MPNHATSSPAEQSPALAQHTRQRFVQFVFPLLITLNQHLDVRLVRTFLAMVSPMI